jgi:chorismate dehydratase
MPIRLGAVSYLNARPLVYGLDRRSDRFSVRFDVPSTCATLLHEQQIDLGLIPSIEYLHGPDYRIVPGVAIASDGPVASVALFTTSPAAAVRSIALDRSSRTSVALLRILCAERFDIEPTLVTMEPDLPSMLKHSDAALLIGDAALFADHERLGLQKIDLGAEWKTLTRLPFVWAFWAGRSGVVAPEDTSALVEARDAGVKNAEEVSRQYFAANPGAAGSGAERARRERRGAEYLRENVRYDLSERERAGLQTFYNFAAELGIVTTQVPVRFYAATNPLR